MGVSNTHEVTSVYNHASGDLPLAWPAVPFSVWDVWPPVPFPSCHFYPQFYFESTQQGSICIDLAFGNAFFMPLVSPPRLVAEMS